VAGWPEVWREKWGVRANELHGAHGWREAERLAYEEMTAE
jgi:hypothetical protein